MRVRFAPSPTGRLHLGNARTALFNWLVARGNDGQLILRVEDTDVDRSVAGSETGIYEDLRWLGLDWDEGPDIGGPHGPYRQSERAASYADAAARLLAAGDAYRCYCDERRLAEERESRRAAGQPPHYAGHCRNLPRDESVRRAADGEPFAIRFRTESTPGAVVGFHDRLRGPVEFPLGELGDAVIVRRDGRPTYNFAVVVDDAAMRIDCVVRGDDHLSNTPRQVLLFRALGTRPPEFAHLPMVRGADGERLSKRHGAVALAEYRSAGYPPSGLMNALALLGWSPGPDRTLVDRVKLLEDFELDRVGRSPATFDPAKLDWICVQHLRSADLRWIGGGIDERLTRRGLLPCERPAGSERWLRELGDMVRGAISHLDQAVERCAGLFFVGGKPEAESAQSVLLDPAAQAVVEQLAMLAVETPPVSPEAWKGVTAEIRRRTGAKGKALFQPIRVAVVGASSGPELDRLVPLITSGNLLFPGQIPTVADRAARTASWARNAR